MVEKSVSVSKEIAAPQEAVWSVVRDFSAPWHPAIATMRADPSNGHLTRVFTVHGEAKEYRERLTWLSESDRSMSYTHVAGIAGADAYNATLKVAHRDGGSVVTMSAELSAPEPRATEIATGTEAIFESGLAALVGLVAPDVVTQHIGQSPRLAISNTSHPTSDTLVLFLHGIGWNRHNWTCQMKALAPYCNTAALDLRGYGDSTLGSTQSEVEDYCNDINAVAKFLDAKHLILCGLSYGAWIATSYAMRYPHRLSALVLAGGCTGMSEADESVRHAFRDAREKPLHDGKTPADFAMDLIPNLVGPDCSKDVQDELCASMSALSAATYADALCCFTNPTETFDFSRLTMPVLMMTGEFDRLAPPAEIQSVSRRIFKASPAPDVRFECLNRAGHVCNLEAPHAFNALLLELIQRVAP